MIKISKAKETGSRDRLLLQVGDKKWHVTQEEARKLFKQLKALI
jgi:hypothetical protein